ncbi:MAG: PDZ domain-containing protein [Lachnospiraceae bacterium]|nr:PDZ domain-containing protein [Lachnospiraceae bacterium]
MEEINNQEEYELIRERIKTRPINRKKLIRRTVITAAMAVIFGVLACITFLVLEPVFSNMLTPEEEPVANEVKIPIEEEEILPEDMILEDEEETRTQIIYQEKERTTTVLEDYNALYDEIYNLSKNCQKSVVKVAGVSQDVDWFNVAYESKEVTTGLIIANNGIELLILTDGSVIKNSENIDVTFFNELVTNAVVKETDKNTGLAIIAVPVDQLTATLLDPDIIAKLGNSKTNRLLAAPVIAVGRPVSNVTSIEQGMITSKSNIINLIDNNYEMFTTDMRGYDASNGVIFNMSGEVLGIIWQKNAALDKNTLNAIGISDLKRTIERMSNGKKRAYLGIRGTDVTLDAINLGVPVGAYVLEIDMESAAMKAGIQSGDVITKIDGFEITSYTVFTEAIGLHDPGDEVTVTVKRLSGEEYKEMDITVVLGE